MSHMTAERREMEPGQTVRRLVGPTEGSGTSGWVHLAARHVEMPSGMSNDARPSETVNVVNPVTQADVCNHQGYKYHGHDGKNRAESVVRTPFIQTRCDALHSKILVKRDL